MVDSLNDLDKQLDEAERLAHVETADVAADIRQIRSLLRLDCEFFVEFFLHEQLDMPVPEFHTEIWGLLTDQEKERILLTIPRDHAKTTLAKLVVIWYWLFTTHRFCIYLSNTSPIAKNACKDIIDFLSTPNFIKVFGRVKMIKSSEQEGLWSFDLPMPNGKIKRCILRGIGWNQQMRGINIDNQRPDIAVIDDVEDNEVVDSPTQQKKLDKWMFGPFLKALARKKKILWLGNMLSKTCLLARLSRSKKWNPVVFGAIVKDSESGELVPLWPDKWTIEALREDYKEYKEQGLLETWMCEMMNMPGHGENGFSAEGFFELPLPSPEECLAAWITIDPAFGEKAANDESAVSVHVIVKGSSIPRTVCTAHGRWDESRLYREAKQLAFYWNAWTWGIEAVAAQKVLLTLFGLYAALDMITGLLTMVPLMAGRGSPKIARIRAYYALMANKEWAMPEDDFDAVTQFLNYNTLTDNNEDDIIDAMAYGPFMQEQYHGLIMASAQKIHSNSALNQPQTGTEVGDV